MAMRLLTWNGRAGAASQFWPTLTARVDLAFLQEVRPPDSTRPALWDAVPGRRWGSALVARTGRLVQVPLVGYEGWVVGGRLEGIRLARNEAPLFAFSVHVPSPAKGRKRMSYFRESIAIVKKIRSAVPRGATVILAGDFNIALAKRASGDPLFRTNSEHRTLDAIEKAGFVSLWPVCNPGLPPAQTLRWTTNPSAPYHCDGFFVPPGVASRASCEVLDSEAIRKASDHNPVVATLR
jgi:hypothetical protein